MIDVIVYKPSPYGLVFINHKLLVLRPQFNIYYIKHERVYESYIISYSAIINESADNSGQTSPLYWRSQLKGTMNQLEKRLTREIISVLVEWTI